MSGPLRTLRRLLMSQQARASIVMLLFVSACSTLHAERSRSPDGPAISRVGSTHESEDEYVLAKNPHAALFSGAPTYALRPKSDTDYPGPIELIKKLGSSRETSTRTPSPSEGSRVLKPQPPDYAAALRSIAEALESAFSQSLFSRAEGSVISVKGEEIYIDFEPGSKVDVGMELSIFKEGEGSGLPLATKTPVEQPAAKAVGKIKIVRALTSFSTAKLLSKTEGVTIAPGDKVRGGDERKARVVVLPFIDKNGEGERVDVHALTMDLIGVLRQAKKFEVSEQGPIDLAWTGKELGPQSVATQQAFKSMANKIAADFVLVNLARGSDSKRLLQSLLISVKDWQVRKEIIVVVR